MSEGIKIPVVVNSGMLVAALIAIVTMYVKVNALEKALTSGVSPEKVASLEERANGQNTRLNDVMERVGRLERARDWEARRREEERPR